MIKKHRQTSEMSKTEERLWSILGFTLGALVVSTLLYYLGAYDALK